MSFVRHSRFAARLRSAASSRRFCAARSFRSTSFCFSRRATLPRHALCTVVAASLRTTRCSAAWLRAACSRSCWRRACARRRAAARSRRSSLRARRPRAAAAMVVAARPRSMRCSAAWLRWACSRSVSYTHLTLPTKA